MRTRPFPRLFLPWLVFIGLATSGCRSGEGVSAPPEEPPAELRPVIGPARGLPSVPAAPDLDVAPARAADALADPDPPVPPPPPALDPPEKPVQSPAETREHPPEREIVPSWGAPGPRDGRHGRWLEPFPFIRVNVAERVVEFAGEVCLDEGWLEQIVCSPGTREHESLVVSPAKPSELHAALLMAGYEPGEPGRWIFEGETYAVVPPQGSPVELFFRYETPGGEVAQVPVGAWVRDHGGETAFPARPWIFGGSLFARNPEFMGPGEHYVADMSGSIVGLVTFGDEVLGWVEVLPDAAAVLPPEWEANPDAMPPVGTKVTVIVRPASD